MYTLPVANIVSEFRAEEDEFKAMSLLAEMDHEGIYLFLCICVKLHFPPCENNAEGVMRTQC
jgi:hypothetical protein